MSGFGLQDIAYVGSNLLGTRQNGAAGSDAAAGASFSEIFQQAGANRAGANQGGAASADTARRTMADPDQWAATHGAPAGSPGTKSVAAQQLSDYLSMPLGKRMFYMVLASMGITEEQYEAMSPEDKAKVAAQVAQRLKDNAENQKQVAGNGETQKQAADRKDDLAVSV